MVAFLCGKEAIFFAVYPFSRINPVNFSPFVMSF